MKKGTNLLGMPITLRTANESDLYEGSLLIFGDEHILLGQRDLEGNFCVMHKGYALALHPSVISKFQVEIPQLKEVK